MKKDSPDKCGISKRPTFSVVSGGRDNEHFGPKGRGPSWQEVKNLLLEAFKTCKIDPAFDHGGLTTGSDRASERRAIIKDALAKVQERPGIFALWCRRAEALAKADEARFHLGQFLINAADEQSRLITLDWLNGGREQELSEIELLGHVRRCCEAIS